jgi:MATE family multidrug resistance protein
MSNAKSWLPGFLQKSKSSSGSNTPPNERTTLLPKPDDEPETGETYELEDGDKTRTQLVLIEFWILLRGSVPVILAYTLQNSLQTISDDFLRKHWLQQRSPTCLPWLPRG